MTLTLDLTKTSVLLWKHPTITTAFTLKIGSEQQLIGFIRTDKSGVNYWKFQTWSPKELTEPKPELSAVEKFQQRQSQAKASNEQPNNAIQNSNNSELS